MTQKPVNLAHIAIVTCSVSLIIGALCGVVLVGLAYLGQERNRQDAAQYYLGQGLTTSGHERKKLSTNE